VISAAYSIPFETYRPVVRRSKKRDLPPPVTLHEYIGGEDDFLVQFAAECILERRPTYSPIVFFGPSATGKSLLANGLASQWKRGNGATDHLVAVSGSEFAREYGHAVQTDSLEELHAKYRSPGLLVIDDLDQTAKKNGAQNELVSILDALCQRGGHVLVTLKDSPPESDALPARLASRLSSGLTVPLVPPGPAARRAILERLAVVNRISVPDDVIELLTESLIDKASPPPTVPQLNDVLQKLHEFSQQRQEPITVALATLFLASQNAIRKPQLRSITKQVCRHFNLKAGELKGPGRQQRVVRARGVAMLLARQLTNKSLEQVGQHFGNRDHSTVLHACRKTQSLVQTDPAIRRAVEELTLQLSVI